MNVLSVCRRFYDINIYRGTSGGGTIRDNRTSSISVLLPILHSDKPIIRENRESNNRGRKALHLGKESNLQN